jgi:hypothetical protein
MQSMVLSVLPKSSYYPPHALAFQAQNADNNEEILARQDGGYAGKVRSDIDHKAYMPAAWRVSGVVASFFGECTNQMCAGSH